MGSYVTSQIRNLLLAGHGSSGKTSLAEAMLHEAGVIGHVGLVEKGGTLSDFTAEEKTHGHSLYSSILHLDYQDTHINLIDSPGYPDFIGQALASFPAVETVMVVISAAAGIEQSTRQIVHWARQRKLCVMIVVNKIDSPHANLPELLENIQATFGKACLPLNLPAAGGTQVVDCFFNPQGTSDFSSIEDAHKAIVEQVIEVDEDLMTLYLDNGKVEPHQLHDPFEKALRQGHLIPVCFTAARRHDDPAKNTGVKELLDIIVKLAPNPMEGNPRPFIRGTDEEHELHAEPDPARHVLAHVFQVRIDPFMGKLSIMRVHQGTITPSSQLYIGDPKQGEGKKPFKVGHLFKLQGKEHVEVSQAIPGDIVAVVKVDEIHRDAVLHDSHDEDLIHLKPLVFPSPMAALAITPKRRGDEQKIADALHKIAEEDPSFSVGREAGTNETVIRGMGELHLRVVLERMKQAFHVEVDTHPPRIPYRETIAGKAEGHHRHKKQTGGAGQFGEVYLRVEPLDCGQGFEFVDDTFGGSIPRQFIPAIEKGVRQVLETGVIAGYPLQGVRVSVYDGKYHDVDSKEIAFITAGKRAFIDAVSKARPVLLEPCVQIEVSAPADRMGDITGDLAGKRGRINSTDMQGQTAIIQAVVPLSEITSYQNQLKSVTGGAGTFTFELSHYEPVPPQVQQQIVSQYKPHSDED